MSTTQKNTLSIDGMHCDHCVDAVQDALEAIDGVTVESVAVGTATVTYDPSVVSHNQLAAALDDAGYTLSA
ncbi:MAG: heavy-metal-associated domain-containing protein [Salinibacter sp.]